MSLRVRLLLALAYVLLLAIVALEVPLASSIRRRVDDEVRSQARAQADVLAATAADLLTPARRGELQALVTRSGATVRGRVIVVGGQGRLLADSAGTGLVGASYGRRPEIAAALAGRIDQRTRHSSTLRQELLATAVPIRSATRPPAVGAVRVTQSVAAVHRAVRRTIVGLVLIGAVVLAVGLIAGLVIARTIARPMRGLDRAARRVAAGDLEARAAVEGSTEQRALARTFNDMTGRLARLVRSQQDFVADASHQLRTPLTGLRLRLEEARAQVDSAGAVAELDAGMTEVDRLAQILEELLVLSRAGERELPGRRSIWARPPSGPPSAGRRRPPSALSASTPTWRRPAAPGAPRRTSTACSTCSSRTPCATRRRAAPCASWSAPTGSRCSTTGRDRPRARRRRCSSVSIAGRGGPPGTGLGLPIARELAGEWDATVVLEARTGGGGRAVVRFAPVVDRVAPAPAAAPAR
jgi:two-component system, OmpR family, sensor kinase